MERFTAASEGTQASRALLLLSNPAAEGGPRFTQNPQPWTFNPQPSTFLSLSLSNPAAKGGARFTPKHLNPKPVGLNPQVEPSTQTQARRREDAPHISKPEL